MSLHADVLTNAIMQASGPHPPTWTAARREAEDILDALALNGWRLTDCADLPDRARARTGDPDTSNVAAESVDDLSARHSAVLFCLYEYGPMTDMDMAASYPGLVERFPDVYVPQTPASLRSRRHELVEAGHVIDTGERGLSEHGRPCAVWAAADATISAASG